MSEKRIVWHGLDCGNCFGRSCDSCDRKRCIIKPWWRVLMESLPFTEVNRVVKDSLLGIPCISVETEYPFVCQIRSWWRVLATALNADPKVVCFHCTSIFEYREPCNFCETWEFHKRIKKPEWVEGG